MKEKYEELEIQVIRFDTEDVITTSGGSKEQEIPVEQDPPK